MIGYFCDTCNTPFTHRPTIELQTADGAFWVTIHLVQGKTARHLCIDCLFNQVAELRKKK